jgi:hypothetical protein
VHVQAALQDPLARRMGGVYQQYLNRDRYRLVSFAASCSVGWPVVSPWMWFDVWLVFLCCQVGSRVHGEGVVSGPDSRCPQPSLPPGMSRSWQGSMIGNAGLWRLCVEACVCPFGWRMYFDYNVHRRTVDAWVSTPPPSPSGARTSIWIKTQNLFLGLAVSQRKKWP